MIVINEIRHVQLRKRSLVSALLLGIILGPPTSIRSAIPEANEPVLRRIEGVTTASIMVSVRPAKAWDVLTDYENIGPHMPDIQAVKIIEREGQRLKLQHTYKAPYTFGLRIKALIEIEEKPKGLINYKILKGDLINKLEGNWILIPVSGGTLVAHRIEIEPALPEFLKPLFRKRFEKNLKNSMRILQELILENS